MLGAQVSLTKLRAGFIALGAVLLIGLGAASWVVTVRLDEAKTDREEMVASRVFDEMEREISAFLQSESERPYYSDLERTNPETWAPFVVGYFAGAVPRQLDRVRIVGAEGPTTENKRRTSWALSQAFGPSSIEASPAGGAQVQVAPAPISPGQLAPEHEDLGAASGAVKKKGEQAAPLAQQKQASGSEIIQSLNRAPERRKAVKAPDPDNEKNADPFSDYSEQF
jgi:hypothetical protein